MAAEMDLDALLLEEDSDDARLSVDEEAKSQASPSRPESPCSVESQQVVARRPRCTGKRREDHRESMARYRQQQRERVVALTAQQAALQQILHRVLAHKKPIRDHGERSALRQLQAEFTELVRVREMLSHEQRELREAVTAYAQRLGSLQTMLARAGVSSVPFDDEIEQRLRRVTLLARAESEEDAARGRDPPAMAEDDAQRASGRWLTFLEHEPRLFYENETHESAARLIRHGFASIQAIHDSLSRRPCEPTRCLGWLAEQTREPDPATGRARLQMRLRKLIPRTRTTLQTLADKTWRFLSSSELIARANSGAVTALVLLRNSPDKTNQKRFRYFSLNARVWAPDGGAVSVLMLVLDKEARLERPLDDALPALRWIKQGGSRLRFSLSRDDNDAIEIEYAGFIESLTPEHAAHLMVANCSALLRWEHLVLPPRLLR